MEATTEREKATDTSDEEDERGTIDLGRLVRTIWDYRRFIALTTASIFALTRLVFLPPLSSHRSSRRRVLCSSCRS